MFINALTKETLREEICIQPKIFNGLIQDLKATSERKSLFFVFDDRGRTLEANYVSHTLYEEGNKKILMAYLKVRLSPNQAVIKQVGDRK